MYAIHFLPVDRRRIALMAAQADNIPLLIVGASGTGKIALAEWIHLNGPRSGKNFYLMRPDRSLAEQIIETQSGTLVIEELMQLSGEDRVVLHDYFKRKSIVNKEMPGVRVLAKARIICTSSELVSNQGWPIDFMMRQIIAYLGCRIDVPPLCQRMHEFDDIMQGLLKEIITEIKKEYILGFSPAAADKLKHYDWPGNIRELRSILKVAAMVAKSDRIELDDLPDFEVNKKLYQSNQENFEKLYLSDLLKIFQGDIEKTSQMIRMNKRHLVSKIQHYGIVTDTAAFKCQV